MTTNYLYQRGELGSSLVDGEVPPDPQNWSTLPDGEKITLAPMPQEPYAARKVGDHMIVHGAGGSVLDKNHEVNHSVDPIAGETRKVRMRCP